MNKFIAEDDVRWRGLATVIAFMLYLTFVGLMLGATLGVVSLGAISQPWFFLFSLSLLTALAWTFGADMLEAARKSGSE